MYTQHYIISNTINQNDPRNHHTPGHNPYMKKNQMLSEKATAEEFDENNLKRLQKIVGKLLYYARSIDPTMFMALNSLAAVKKKPTIETTKQINQFLNYSATRPDTVIEYRKIGIIIHIYLNASYISEPESRRRDVGYFFLGPKYNTLIK